MEPEGRWIWALNAKACSTSIKVLISGCPVGQAHTTLRTGLFEPEEFTKRFSFVVVRNPWDRLVSAWASKIPLVVLRKDLRNMGCTPYMPFDEFVRVVCETKVCKQDNHMKPQGVQIPDVGCVCRFESIEADWEAVRASTGLGELPRHGASRHEDPDKYKTPELVQMVAEYYKADYERFGYLIPDGVPELDSDRGNVGAVELAAL
tara:strand:- start:6909 stop:7523 length:615 start_codon:yes stop_codon:yes gene_type:complete